MLLRHFSLLALIICALLAGQGRADELDDPLEPGVTEFTNGTDSNGPPEPSANPQFSEGAIVVAGSSVTSQGPPEPSTRPHFTNSSSESQGPPEPSTRPHFSDSSSIPEPSTRPHFSNSSSVDAPPEPSTRPHFTSSRVPDRPSSDRSYRSKHSATPSNTTTRRRPLFTSFYSGPTQVITAAPPRYSYSPPQPSQSGRYQGKFKRAD